MPTQRLRLAAAWFAVFAFTCSALADDPADPQADLHAEERAQGAAQAEPASAQAYALGGYVEAFYQWNFNRPANDITNYRGFDNRHNTFTLANVALDAQWDYHDVVGRLTLQIGHTPSTYYASEPAREGAGGTNASNAALWKYLQQAYAGYRFIGALTLSAGLFLSPIGVESMAIKDNWNWSRSNLFYGSPFYHTGARASYAVSEAWTFTLAAYNGWNSVVDNNAHKSLAVQATYTRPELALALLYFGGVERPRHALEGQPWRHLFDAHATWHATTWLSLIAHANAGFEHNRFGRARWAAAALYARAQLLPSLYFAVRGDVFCERVPSGADAIFWPVPWVSSGTATLDYRPYQLVSFRLEFRHDQAHGAMFFGRSLRRAEDGQLTPNRRAQDSVTLGLTAWF